METTRPLWPGFLLRRIPPAEKTYSLLNTGTHSKISLPMHPDPVPTPALLHPHLPPTPLPPQPIHRALTACPKQQQQQQVQVIAIGDPASPLHTDSGVCVRLPHSPRRSPVTRLGGHGETAGHVAEDLDSASAGAVAGRLGANNNPNIDFRCAGPELASPFKERLWGMDPTT